METNEMEEIINRAVEAVFERLYASAPRRKILMVFTGAGSGYVAGRDAVRLLVKAGQPLRIILSSAAGSIIGADNLRKVGATDIIQAGDWVWAPTVIQECDLILVPTLSMNTAAKLAAGMMDSLPNTIILGGLLAGKPVVAVDDGADPFGDGGRVFGSDTTTAPLLRQKIAAHLPTLKAYGIHLVHKEQFLAAILSFLMTPPQPAAAAQLPVAPDEHTPASNSLSEMWITTAELSRFSRGQTIHIPRGACLTPLARETAQRLELILIEG